MRKVLSALTDGGMIAVISYAAFRLGDWGTPCGGNKSNCAPLAPVIILCILLGLALYFAAGILLWKTTPAQRLFRLDPASNQGPQL